MIITNKEILRGLWDSAKPPVAEDFADSEFEVFMVGKLRFIFRGDVKRFISDKGAGYNKWLGFVWGSFKLVCDEYATSKLEYDSGKIIDFVRKITDDLFIGQFWKYKNSSGKFVDYFFMIRKEKEK